MAFVGTGIQAHVQLQYLQRVTDCRHVLVWGRGEDQLTRYRRDMQTHGYAIETTRSTADVLRTCNLVVTCTPATSPLLHAADLQAGTHITAVGSDTSEKQELDAAILGQADVVVADSISQCLERGDIHKAIEHGCITPDDLVELGNVIRGASPGRTSDDQITVADLTGVAVQDIQIATAVVEAMA